MAQRVEEQLEARYGGDFRDVKVVRPLGAEPILPLGSALTTPFEASGGPYHVQSFDGVVNMRWPHDMGYTTYHCAALREHVLASARAAVPDLAPISYTTGVCIGEDVALDPRPTTAIGENVDSITLDIDARGMTESEEETALTRWREALSGHGIGTVTVR